MDAIIIFTGAYHVDGIPQAHAKAIGPFVDYRDAHQYLIKHGFVEIPNTVCYRGSDVALDEEISGMEEGEERHLEWIATLNILHAPSDG